jgi:hypothetical protein
MRKLLSWAALSLLFVTLFASCSNGPSPEEQTREQREATETAKKQANFFNTPPPPLERPGQ